MHTVVHDCILDHCVRDVDEYRGLAESMCTDVCEVCASVKKCIMMRASLHYCEQYVLTCMTVDYEDSSMCADVYEYVDWCRSMYVLHMCTTVKQSVTVMYERRLL
jgi:hypothetical protein